MPRELRVKRIHERANPEDGTRVLVDRIWPRGISKERAALDAWMPEVAPSTQLRKWFGHDPVKWEQFKKRYAEEIDENVGVLDSLRDLMANGPVTLLYSAKDTKHNQAIALRELLGR